MRGFVGEIYSALTRLLERLFGASAGSGWISKVVLGLVLAAAAIVAANLRQTSAAANKAQEDAACAWGRDCCRRHVS